MGVSYQAVGWNRQKKWYDILLAFGCILYLLIFCIVTILVNPDYTFETLLIRSTSTLALLLLHIILSIGPLSRIDKRFLPLLYNRRHLGVTMCIVALVHGVFSIMQFHTLGNVSPFVSLFFSNTRYGSLVYFPFQSLGFFALIILVFMAVTSHDFWLHQLTPVVWKSLHILVYVAYSLLVMHVMLGVMQNEINGIYFFVIIAGVVWIVALHLWAGIKEISRDRRIKAIVQDGFTQVCHVNDIETDRAKIFCLNDERIAVFKTNGMLYAVHNVCKHQLGPLGEGKVIDGCITCPWHGYQYLPQNGQSPPPFKEQVNTYDVRIINGEVWLNPKPYAEGTERPGAVI